MTPTRLKDGEPAARVLVVEDDPASLQFLEIMLVKRGYEVITAVDATHARAELSPACIEGFSCVITDYRMPDTTGLELLAWIQEQDADLATIIVTAEGEKRLISESMRGGAVDFLEKPIAAFELEVAVSRAVKRTRRQRQLTGSESKARELGEQLRQAQKLEAIGQLAGGVAHDFNNLLAATMMHLGLLLDNPHLTPETKESLREVEQATMRGAGLVRQLLLFSRREVAQVAPMELNRLIEDLLKMLVRLLGEQTRVNFDQSGPLWLEADAGMIEQVVMNLCINARDAMPRGGELTLRTTLVDRDPEAARTHADARPGRFICLEVRDTGCGMDAKVLGRIFEPFFTTKEVGKGTGLGLATVYGIVKQHAGWVETRSVVGHGTTFQVYLPAGEPPARAGTGSGRDEAVRRGSETILLVEDELAVRQATALALRLLGYAVVEAGDATQALAMWERHQEEIQLLFTDMVMPGTMSGLELAKRLQADDPALGVIISSGYSAVLAGHPPAENPGIAYLPKPYNRLSLAQAVRRALDQAGLPEPEATTPLPCEDSLQPA